MRGDGCCFFSSCLACEFPDCQMVRGKIKISRNLEIQRRYKSGESVANLALTYNMSRRNIERIIKLVLV